MGKNYQSKDFQSAGQKALGYQDWKKITGVKILSLEMLSTLPATKLNKEEQLALNKYISSEQPLTEEDKKLIDEYLKKHKTK